MEIWKDIEGYEGLYQVSNKGRIKSLNYRRTGKEGMLKGKPDKNGYLIVFLYKKGEKPKPFLIHRLVAKGFIPNVNDLPEVNHIDENKENNHVENLEWCDRKYNMNYGTRTKRSVENRKGKKHKKHKKHKLKRQILCVETGEIFDTSQDVIDIMFNGKGCSSNIKHNLCGRCKSAYNYHFVYIERKNY